MFNPERRHRVLTDADVNAIAEALRVKVKEDFYHDLGRGVWGMAWKAIILGIVSVAAYGAIKGGN